ncbi:LOW QUALITY PROTEIN: UBN2_3 domain-containing protein, partial [Cephalotus follicularis]
IDFNDPLFLHPSDTPGVNLVNEQLLGTQNYGVWSKATRIAHTTKNKIGFIDGSCKKPAASSPNLHQWERCNAIVLSWILNTVSKELFNGNLTISTYYSKLKQLWDEYDSLVTLPSCGCQTAKAYLEHDQQQKLFQFLMGLNDSYGNIRSILLMSPLPTLGQAYSLINQEESDRGIIS